MKWIAFHESMDKIEHFDKEDEAIEWLKKQFGHYPPFDQDDLDYSYVAEIKKTGREVAKAFGIPEPLIAKE